jgi:hypothetical protein
MATSVRATEKLLRQLASEHEMLNRQVCELLFLRKRIAELSARRSNSELTHGLDAEAVSERHPRASVPGGVLSLANTGLGLRLQPQINQPAGGFGAAKVRPPQSMRPLV